MSNPVLRAFFYGRALAEVLNEKAEEAFTNALSELGKFDAEQRERLRQVMEEVRLRAEQEAAKEGATTGTESSPDLQEEIDELRAEIARLRAELKTFRSESI
jgi:predicted RNase H-like nuclease (RuvC/YqgF family)